VKDDKVYLSHMLDMCGRLGSIVGYGLQQFLADHVLQDAALRNLHTLTETSQRLTDELKTAHPEIDWKTLARFRNVVVHDYLGLDLELIWTVMSSDIPELGQRIQAILGDTKR